MDTDQLAAEAQSPGWEGPSRRRVPRFQMQAPMDVTVLRSGIPDTLPGRSLNVCERGIAAVIAGELVPGESVGVAVQLPLFTEPLRTRATVRYHDKLRCGMEFVALTAEQRASIRDWAVEAKAVLDTEPRTGPAVDIMPNKKSESAKERDRSDRDRPESFRQPSSRRLLMPTLIALLVVGIVAVIFWWRWNLGWQELESGLKGSDSVTTQKPQAQIPAEVMQKLVVHRVEPVYPAEARKDRLEGTIALDIIVGRDGSVLSMQPLNGPDVLARAAMDALRWWKFEPYRINGEPSVVETTVAVEFKR
jgi:TonB family protein